MDFVLQQYSSGNDSSSVPRFRHKGHPLHPRSGIFREAKEDLAQKVFIDIFQFV